MEFASLSIVEAARALRAKEFSVKELTEAALTQTERQDAEHHAFLSVYADAARTQALAADKLLASGEATSLLTGIPYALKDNILVKGERCSAASRILETYRASYDATVTERLGSAGAVLLGKTNLDEFAMGASTEHSAFGPSRNPHDTSRVPGGTSGGSAAAVAADDVLFALGSDTGGSVRQPAAFCGVVGLRPTYGRVSRYGLIAMASSLDQIGPMTKRAQDAAFVLEAISGFDGRDSTSAAETFSAKDLDGFSLEGAVVGLPKEYFIDGLERGVEEKVQGAIKALEERGASVREISLPHTHYAVATYYIIVPSEVSANLARYDGIRYGFSDEGATDIASVYAESRERGFGAEAKRRIMLGTFALSHGYYDAYYLKAQRVRTRIIEDFKKAFSEVDIIVTPTTPTTAFKLGARTEDPLSMYLADIFTAPASLAGLPAVSVPAGDVDGLPVGMQLIGDYFKEARILSAAREFEAAA